jgi:hypothetical protein
MSDRGWQRAFDDPPKKDADTPEWQAAIEALTLAVDLGGPTMFARIGVIRALNRHHKPVAKPHKSPQDHPMSEQAHPLRGALDR